MRKSLLQNSENALLEVLAVNFLSMGLTRCARNAFDGMSPLMNLGKLAAMRMDVRWMIRSEILVANGS